MENEKEMEQPEAFDLIIELYYSTRQKPISVYCGTYDSYDKINEALDYIMDLISKHYAEYMNATAHENIVYFKTVFVPICGGRFSVKDLIAVDYDVKKVKKNTKKHVKTDAHYETELKSLEEE